MQRLLFLVIMLFALISNTIYAGSPKQVKPALQNPRVQQFINHKDWSFVENKGQVASPNPEKGENAYDFHPEIKYYGHQGGVYLYCKPGMLSFVFTKTEKAPEQISEATGTTDDGVGVQNPEPLHGKQCSPLSALRSSISTSRTDLVLLNSNPNPEIIASDKQEYYENFYLAYTPEQGITNVHNYKTITYKSVYPHIDMVLQAKENGMEYSFIVHPGGKVSDIQLQWNGVAGAQALANGGLKFTNYLGNLEESAPKSFTEGKLVPSSFAGNGFKVGDYDKGKDLVIDPNLVWGTYYGGSGEDEAYAATTDGAGDIYITGRTASSSGIALSGAYQTSMEGTYNVFLAKFNSAGTLKWATYYGSGWSEAHAISTDNSGNLFITGFTSSTVGLATSGAYQTSSYYSQNAFLAKFTNSGSLAWGTYFGGYSYSDGTGISNDATGNVYFTGSTSSSNHIATSGSYQTSLGGSYDAFLAKFGSSGSISWATYYGGSGYESGYAVKNDGSGNVYIVGSTGSNNGISTSGSFQSSFAGNNDAFLAKFDSSGSRIWATYYGGVDNDFGKELSLDVFGNVYITGNTSSKSSIATPGAYQTLFGGEISGYGGDAFLAKFSNGGNLTWATYYGGSGDDYGEGLYSDAYGNIYMAGNTSSKSGIATSGAYLTSYSGGTTYKYDAFLAKFTGSGNLSVATYYGGKGDDYGNGVLTDTNKNVYLIGSTDSSMGLATSGAYQTSSGGGIGDAYIAKFNLFVLNDAGVDSIINPTDSLCPDSELVKVRLQNYGTKALTSTTIGLAIDDSIRSSYSWIGTLLPDSAATVTLGNFKFSSGNMKVKSWTSKPNGVTDSLTGNDTTISYIWVKTLPAAKTIHSTNICGDSSINIGAPAVTGSTYSWTSSPPGFSSSNSNPFVNPDTTTTYTLAETNDGCSYTHSFTLTLGGNAHLYDAGIDSIYSPGTKICAGSYPVKADLLNHGCYPLYSATIGWSVNGKAQTSYKWTGFLGSGNSSIVNLGNYNFSTGSYAIKVWSSKPDGQIDSLTTNDTSSINIVSNALPKADPGSASTICYGQSASIGVKPVSGSKYSWSSNPFGFKSTNSDSVVSPVENTWYYLDETNVATGCYKRDSVQIVVNPVPSAKVSVSYSTCANDEVYLGSYDVSGDTYSWTSNPKGFSSTSADPVFYPDTTRMFYLTETVTATGCSSSDSVKITVLETPPSKNAANTICAGNSVTIGVSAVSDYTYGWYTDNSGGSLSGSSTLNVNPTGTTTYYLAQEVKTTGCYRTDTIVVNVNPTPAANTGAAQTICLGTSTTIGATTKKGHSYSWTSDPKGFTSTAANPGINPTNETLYKLTETIDSSGCDNTDSVLVIVNPLPKPYAGSPETICYGGSAIVSNTPLIGHDYSWTSNPKGFYSAKSSVSVSPTVTTEYELTDTIVSTGCYASDSVRITVDSLPAAAVIHDSSVCFGSSISIGASSIPGSSYSWASSQPGFGSIVSNPSVSPTSTSSYTLTETNLNGCENSNSVTITVNPLPAASVIANTGTCTGASISIGDTAIPGSIYSWASSPTGFSSTSSSPSVSPTSTITYILIETNSNGCIKSDSVTITVNPLPLASINSDTVICKGSSVSIGGSKVIGSNYSWISSPAGFSSTISNPYVSPASTTSYTLTEINSLGCAKSGSVLIKVNPLPAAAMISNTAVCSGSPISIGATAVAGSAYAWTSVPSGFTSTLSNPLVFPTLTTTYKLTETNSFGCSSADSATIIIHSRAKASFSFTDVCPGDSCGFTDRSILASAYTWYFGDGDTASIANPKHLYSSMGKYTVSLKVTSSSGCTDSSSQNLSISPCVWPGDANNDKVVDMKDLLAIGVAYGSTGYLRPSASLTWTGQPSPDWDSSFPSGVNYKHADCNGDSIVNYADTIAVSANYGFSHTKSGTLNQGNPSDPEFTIKYLKDTVNVGDTLVAQLILGSNTKPVSNLYGLCFSLSFDPALFQTDKAFLKMSPSFLGTNGTELIAMAKKSFSVGNLDMGICRTDRLDTSGTGVIATLYLPVNATLTQDYIKTRVAIFNNFQITHNESSVPLYFNLDSVVLKYHNSDIQSSVLSNSTELNIFPNPFQSNLTISYNLDQKSRIKMDIFDLEGKQITSIVNEEEVSGAHQFDINAEKYHLNPGVYLLKFIVNDEVESRRLVKF